MKRPKCLETILGAKMRGWQAESYASGTLKICWFFTANRGTVVYLFIVLLLFWIFHYL